MLNKIHIQNFKSWHDTGKKAAKRITPDSVEFADGDKIDIRNLDYRLIKPLIWW